MKRWLSFLGGLAVLSAFGFAVWQMKGGQAHLAKPVSHSLAAGSEVELLLLAPVDSGQNDKGDTIPIIVGKDVIASGGAVLIAAGQTGLVEVTKAREASAMTSLVNQPARLSLRLLPIESVDGQKVELSLPDEGEITRNMTPDRDLGDAVDAAANHDEVKSALAQISGQLRGEKSLGEMPKVDLDRILKDTAAKMKMPNVELSLQKGQSLDSLIAAADKLKSGDVGGLSGADLLVSLGALKELGGLGASVDRTIRGVFKGRNITLPTGFAIRGTVAKTLSIQCRP